MNAISLFPLSDKAIEELDELYRTTKDVRIRTRVQMVLLSGEQGLVTENIAVIVRHTGETVRLSWFPTLRAMWSPKGQPDTGAADQALWPWGGQLPHG